MLDVLAEFIIDLLQNRGQKKKQTQPGQQGGAQTRNSSRPQRTGQGHWPERSANDPYAQYHVSDREGGRETQQSLTIDEVMRRMHEKVQRGDRDAPVLDPQFHPQRSLQRQDASAGRSEIARTPLPDSYEPRVREVVRPGVGSAPVRRAGPAQTYAPAASRAVEQSMEDPAISAGTEKTSEFIAKLRSNPSAAREAFVYSEIFGRPLGERM